MYTRYHELTFTTSSSAGQTVIAGTLADGLMNAVCVEIIGQMLGATGGTLDFYIQHSADLTHWVDYAHFAQLLAGASAIKQKVVGNLPGSIVTIGVGTATAATPALAAGVCAGGPYKRAMRVVYVTGAGISAGAAQTFSLEATYDTDG